MSQVLLTDEAGKPIKNTNPLPVADTGNLTKLDELIAAIRNIAEAAVDTGIATSGTVNGLTDSSKDWPVNGFTNLVVEITTGTGEGQIRRITSNTADTLTPDPVFATAPDETSQYRIAFFGKMASDITHIGGTAQTGRDWSADLAKLDVALSTLSTKTNQETIADYIDGLEAALGAAADAEAAGNGSLIAIIKRLRTLLNGGLPAALSAGGGVKVGVVDSLPAGSNNIGDVDIVSSALPTGAATSAKQDTLIGHVDGIEGYVDGIESALATLNGKDFATQTTLAAILAKIIAAPATESTLEAVRAALTAGGLPSSTLETTHHNAATTNGNGTAANVAGYGPIAFQAVGTWDGATITYQGSVDGTNYVALPGSSAVTADGIFQPVDPGVAGYKSVRAVISGAGATTSLTVKSLAIAVAKPTSADVVAVGKAAHDAAASGNPVRMAGVYRATAPAVADGDVVDLKTDAAGRQEVVVSGSNIIKYELLKSHTLSYDPYFTGGNAVTFGNTAGYATNATLLDVSKYEDVGFLLINNLDKSLGYINIEAYSTSGVLPSASTKLYSVLSTDDSLAAGASKWYTSNTGKSPNYPLLSDVHIGIRLLCAQTTCISGNVSVLIFGKRR